MLTRRNIRVKVMQTLYTLDSLSDTAKVGEHNSILQKKIDQSHQLFTYLIYFITEVAMYAEKDAAKRANKHLPSAEDLSVSTKISGNQIVWQTLENRGFSGAVAEMKLKSILENELVRSAYLELAATQEYKDYIEEQNRNKKNERFILEFLFNTILLPNENFIAHIEENFVNWDDDAEMMHALVMNYLKQTPKEAFYSIIDPEKKKFAQQILSTVLDKSAHLLELIKPKLKNWDADRIAALDMIMLQMGVSELLYFETIPTKVTINEYIDIAKAYSTPQSGQFVNGILDNIHKELVAGNKIHKKDHK